MVVGAKVLDIQTSAIGYADDLAIVTTDRASMQQLIDIAYSYSCKWRFDFSPSKCAVMIFGRSIPQCAFHLGPTNLNIVTQYTHVGVTLVSKGKIAVTEIKKRLQACRRTFFTLVGSNLYKTSLSPIALSKMYWSVCVPKFLSGGEVKCFTSQEYEEFGKFHKSMARDIQNLPGNTPDPMVLASLGWKDVVSQVDYVKLMFVQRILNLGATSIYRVIFLRRLFFILMSGIINPISPIAQIVKILLKYNLLEHVVVNVEEGIIPTKSEWKRVVSKAIEDKVHGEWRFLLSLYPKLEVYRAVVNKYSFLCWWEMAKSLPFLKKACVGIARLLSGCHILNVAMKLDVVRELRFCDICNTQVTEDLYHFVMECRRWNQLRNYMLNTIDQALSPDTLNHWQSLSNKMRFLILLGLDYPLPLEELMIIRYTSCVHILKMYRQRRAWEPP